MLLTARMKDITGLVLGSLTAIRPAYKRNPNAGITWEWRCVCGKSSFSELAPMRRIAAQFDNPKVPSCGCVKKQRAKEVHTTHGYARKNAIHPLYDKYCGMIERCYSKKCATYPWYGGKEVTVCDAWKGNPKAFIEWALANGWEPGLHLDKDILCEKLGIHPKIYSPQTCLFITASKNTNQTRQPKR